MPARIRTPPLNQASPWTRTLLVSEHVPADLPELVDHATEQLAQARQRVVLVERLEDFDRGGAVRHGGLRAAAAAPEKG